MNPALTVRGTAVEDVRRDQLETEKVVAGSGKPNETCSSSAHKTLKSS